MQNALSVAQFFRLLSFPHSPSCFVDFYKNGIRCVYLHFARLAKCFECAVICLPSHDKTASPSHTKNYPSFKSENLSIFSLPQSAQSFPAKLTAKARASAIIMSFLARRPDKVSAESTQGYYTRRASELERRKNSDYTNHPNDQVKFHPNGDVKSSGLDTHTNDFAIHTRRAFTDTFHEVVDVVSDVIPGGGSSSPSPNASTPAARSRDETAHPRTGKQPVLYANKGGRYTTR